MLVCVRVQHAHRSSLEERFEQKLEALNEFVEERDLPLPLRDKLRSYYSIRYPTMRVVDDYAVTGDLEYSLQREIIVALYQDVVVAVPLFRFCKVETHQDICFRLRPGTIKSALTETLCTTLYVSVCRHTWALTFETFCQCFRLRRAA